MIWHTNAKNALKKAEEEVKSCGRVKYEKKIEKSANTKKKTVHTHTKEKEKTHFDCEWLDEMGRRGWDPRTYAGAPHKLARVKPATTPDSITQITQTSRASPSGSYCDLS